jgi:Uncharacterized conserved protein
MTATNEFKDGTGPLKDRKNNTNFKCRLASLGGLALFIFLSMFLPSQPAFSQVQDGNAGPLPALTGPQKKTLVLIAREVIDAVMAGRQSREATVEPRLTAPQPMVVSIYVDRILRARAWRLRGTLPIYLEARDLTYQALASPKVSDRPLSIDELSRAEVSLAVLSNYTRVKDDSQIPPRAAVIIYNGFVEWMALPGDVSSNLPADLLTYACEQAGLRPQVWLLPQTAIYTATVEGAREGWNSDF